MPSSTMTDEVKNINKGKRKIAIEPITSKTKKQVTFAKRRKGLFKKASELCSMCGAEAAVITFSCAGKSYSFGHPDADAIIHRYVGNNTNSDDVIIRGTNDVKLGTCTQEYKSVITQIDTEKKETKVLANGIVPHRSEDGTDCGFWWDRSIDDLGLDELEQFKVALEGLRNKIVAQVVETNNNNNYRTPMVSIVPQSFDFGAMDQSLVAQGIDSSSSGTRDYEGVTGDSLLDLIMNSC